jgi:transitional endoplasmic reticulum ATPase
MLWLKNSFSEKNLLTGDLMENKEIKEVSLRVQEPDPNNVGRNIVTLDRQSKNLLGVTSGDIIEITGSKKTAATIWPSREEDEGKELIRMDNLIRHNCGANLGEKVTIKKTSFSEAKKVVLAPTHDVRIIASGYDRILKKNFIGRPLVKGDRVWINVFGSGFIYSVADSIPRGIVKVTDFTQFILKEEPVAESAKNIPEVAYENIGGIEEQIQKVRELIELPMRYPVLFKKLGIEPPKGVLLHGPPGTGKTLLAKALANETKAYFVAVNSAGIMSKFVGEAEERIREVFTKAQENAPSIIFFDEIDAIAPKRDEVAGEVERRVVAQILSSMDGMEARGNVIVIAATNRIHSIDEALRRPGRFDREIEIGVPSAKGRKEIFQVHSRGLPLNPSFDLKYLKEKLKNTEDNGISKELKKELAPLLRQNLSEEEFFKKIPNGYAREVKKIFLDRFFAEFAGITHGFVGADIEVLVKEAAMKALRRYLPKINFEDEAIPADVLESLEVNRQDFLDALKEVQPSALREVAIEIPNVNWDNIGGLDEIKKELKQAVEWPIKKPDAFVKMGISPPKGILLYGPPGTGKTLLARAIATESQANFISIKGPQLISHWVGESERGIRKVFKRARQSSPVIVFFDEIDSIAPIRGTSGSSVTEKMLLQLLTELDGIEQMKDVVFIAATNRPDILDTSLLRPGRIDKIIKVGAPNKKTREAIFEVHTKNVPFEEDVKISHLAEITEGYSGADIEGLVREAVLIRLEKNKFIPSKVKNEDIAQAMEKILPSISEDTALAYDEFRKKISEFKPSYVR